MKSLTTLSGFLGKLRVDNEVGGAMGSSIESAGETAEAAKHTATPLTNPTTDQRRVVVVDDEQDIADMVAMVVEYDGFMAHVAGNGRQALDLVRAFRPALIITDYMMPEVDGVELIRLVRAEAASSGFPAPPIVLMSAMRPQSIPDTGADALLLKPFSVAALHQLLARFLGGGSGSPPGA
jgi:CheY-like chemotaxis protein